MHSSSRSVKVVPWQHPSTTSSSPAGDLVKTWTAKVKRMTWIHWMELLLPCSRWFRTYKWREYLQSDLLSGISIRIMLVLQAWMAYSLYQPLCNLWLYYSFCHCDWIFPCEILSGEGVSLVFVIHESANPHMAVTYIDSSAVQALKDLYQEYKFRDIQIVISNPNRDVLLTFSRSGVVELIGKEWFFVRVHDAVQVCLPLVKSLKETTKI